MVGGSHGSYAQRDGVMDLLEYWILSAMRNLSSDGRFNTSSWNCRKLVAEQLLRGSLPSQYKSRLPPPPPSPAIRWEGRPSAPALYTSMPHCFIAMCTVQRTLALYSERTLMKE